ncbi:MAG: single-stranded DNA-binding protein, partial [Bacilli bacterium]
LAVNRTFSNQQGEREADFINCVVWRKQAENTANFLKKGSLAGVEGRLQTRTYDGQDGKRVYVTEVVCDAVQFLEPRGTNAGSQMPSQSYERQNDMGGFAQSPSQNPVNPYQQEQVQERPAYQSQDDPFARPQDEKKVTLADDDLPF